jgi:hypothetical protein
MARTLAEGISSSFFEAAQTDTTPNAEFPDFLDFYGVAMDRALGIETASLSAIVQLNASALNIYSQFAPAVCDLVGTAASAFAVCMESQLSWLTLMLPRPYQGSEDALPAIAPSSAVAGRSSGQARTTEEIERSIDVVLGDVVLGARTAAPLAQAAACGMGAMALPGEALAHSMDVVLGAERAA